MNLIVRLVLSVALMAGLTAPAAAQPAPAQPNEPEPILKIGSTNAQALMRDIQYVMSLSPEGRRQFSELEKYLDVFLIGIDRARPARMDVLFGEEAERYQMSLPIASPAQLRNFRQNNLNALGITSRQIAGQLFQLGGAYVGFMRHHHDYVTISEVREWIPPGMPHPIQAVRHLLERNYDIGIDGRNVPQGQEQRRQTYQRTRQRQLEDLEQREDETDDEFAIRRAMLVFQLDEFERIYVEAAKLLMGGIVDSTRHEARIEGELEALADTSLEAAIQEVGQQASRFANIERIARPIVSARANLPLDELRQRNMLAISQLMRAREQNLIAADRERTAEERENSRRVIDLFFDMVDAGIRTGWLDTFAEGETTAPGRNRLVAGVVPEDGTAAVEILRLLPQARRESRVQLNIAQEGGVQIHSLTIPNDWRDDFVYFFGSETLYVGTAETSLWWAAGENALEQLTATIRQAGTPPEAPAPEEPFLDAVIKLFPWTDLYHRRMGQRGDVAFRRQALQAFRPGDDMFTIVGRRVGDEAVGRMHGQSGVLRLIGLMLADFTEELDR